MWRLKAAARISHRGAAAKNFKDTNRKITVTELPRQQFAAGAGKSWAMGLRKIDSDAGFCLNSTCATGGKSLATLRKLV
jgi:hypothetical protein